MLQVSFPGATAFPYAFNWLFSQLNATTIGTFTCTPPSIITCTPNQTLTNNTLNGTLSGNLLGAGTFQVGGAASGYTIPLTTFNVYGVVTLSSGVSPVSLVPPTPQQVTVTQAPAGSMLTSTLNCVGGANAANVTMVGGTGPSPQTLTLTPISPPTTATPPTNACTVTVNGQGDGPGASLTIGVNVTSTAIGISAHRRKPM